MAIVRQMLDLKGWEEWVASRPPSVQDLCRRFPPDRLYRMGDKRVTIYSYSEDGTLTVEVSPEFNLVVMPRKVFGVPASDLVECDLPETGEPVGCIFDEVHKFQPNKN